MTTFKQLAEELGPISDQMERINDMMSAAAAPIHDVFKTSAFAKLNLSTAEMFAAKQRELDETFASFEDRQIDPAIYKLKSAGLPPTPEPVFPDIDVTVDRATLEIEPPRWWQQGWVWGAIGSSLVLVDIVLRLI